MDANMSPPSLETRISRLLRAISTPARLQILLAIGTGEACVCHLEEALGLRQAYISQQLMTLRDVGLLQTRREGRFIYYRLKNPELLDLIRLAGEIAGVSANQLEGQINTRCAPPCGLPAREAALPDAAHLVLNNSTSK